MPTFYTLDRRGFLRENERFQLITAPSLNPFNDQTFAEGLSKHGELYHLQFGIYNQQNIPAGAIEYSLELVRRLQFPDKPSRLQSMFACEHLDHAKHFRGTSGSKISAPIFEVNSDNYHRGDMNLINAGCNMAEFHRRMVSYWQGESYAIEENYEAFWEIIIPLPATIGRRVA